MQEVIRFAEDNFGNFVEKLKSLVRIPSISFPGFPKAEVAKSARAVASLLKEEGLENVEILEIDGAEHPYVYGDFLHAPQKPTLLLYAHHDVQPVGREEWWKSPPFEPTLRGERLYGRGAADDKAGIIVHTSAISSYLRAAGKLPINVKLIIEGEEEIGSGGLEALLRNYREKLKADAMILTDTGNFDTGIPSLTTSLRGLVSAQLEVRVMERSLHSGMWGGAIPDPVVALSKIIAPLVDSQGRIAIPGIYDDVRPLSSSEQQSIRALNYTNEKFRDQASLLKGVELIGGPEHPWVKKTRLPSLSVNAIQASSRKQFSNIINESAWCRIGIRIVPDMDPRKTEKQLMEFLTQNLPWGVDLRIELEPGANWWMTTPEGEVFEIAKAALTKAFAKECVFIGEGGSIPFVGPFASVLGGVPALLIGVEDPYTNAHSENESVHLGDLKKSIWGAIYLYDGIARGSAEFEG